MTSERVWAKASKVALVHLGASWCYWICGFPECGHVAMQALACRCGMWSNQ